MNHFALVKSKLQLKTDVPPSCRLSRDNRRTDGSSFNESFVSFSLSQSKHTRIRVELPGRRHLNAADSRDESLYPRLHIPSAAMSAKRDRNPAVKGQHEPGRRGTCGRARLKCANKFHWEAVLGVCGAVRDFKTPRVTSIKLLWCLPTRRAGASADKEAAIKGASLIPLIAPRAAASTGRAHSSSPGKAEPEDDEAGGLPGRGALVRMPL